MRFFTFAVSAIAAIAAVSVSSFARADVVDLTPDNFDTIVDGSKHVLVEFYAPWCGHCKALAPEYERVGKHYKPADGVVIAKVDADKERDLAQRFEIRGFPTLKIFEKGSTEGKDFEAPRTAEGIVEALNDIASVKRSLQSEPSDVIVLTDSNFDKIVLDPTKDVFVEFYAPWCGHCKALAPKWDALGKAFAGEDNVIIAKLDADKHREAAGKFGVSGYPTIKWFGKDSKDGEAYNGGRELEDLVTFTNEKANVQRKSDGSLKDDAARIVALDDLIKNAAGIFDSSLLTKFNDAVKTVTTEEATHAKMYVKVLQKIIEKGKNYVSDEIARLTALISNESVSPKKKNLFYKRANILKAFQGGEA